MVAAYLLEPGVAVSAACAVSPEHGCLADSGDDDVAVLRWVAFADGDGVAWSEAYQVQAVVVDSQEVVGRGYE